MAIKKIIMLLTTPLPSFMRVAIYRALGAKIGKNVKLNPLAILIADDILIDRDSFIDPLTLTFNLKKMHIGKASSIRFGSMVYGHGGGSFSMGDFSTLGLFTMVNCTGNFSAGKYFGTGPRCLIYTHGNFFPTLDGYTNQIKDVTTGDYVWLHMNVIVLPGVTIGNHVMVYSQGVVSKDIPTDTTLVPPYKEQIRVRTMRKKVTSEFEIEWCENVWNELNDYITKFHDFGSVNKKNSTTEVVIGNKRIFLYDGGKVSADQIQQKETLVYFLKGEQSVYDNFRDHNWIDFKNNLYHFPKSHPLLKEIIFYLNLHKAQYFYEYEQL
jgi:acetyltransferase-like isoleucine patch superfamily enzyme